MDKRKSRLIGQLNRLLDEISGQDFSGEDPAVSFFELGLDSLMLTQVSLSVGSQFGVKVTFRQLMNDLDSVDALAGFLDRQIAPETATMPAPADPLVGSDNASSGNALPSRPSVIKPPGALPAITPALDGGTSLERLVRQQLQVMAQQLEVLRRGGALAPGITTPAPPVAAVMPGGVTTTVPLPPSGNPVIKAVRSAADEGKRFGPFKGVERGPTGGLTAQQEKALAALIADYNQRTASSKKYAERHREHLCDPRAAGNFRQLWKEMVYPIVCARSRGSRIWDIDGNEYIDVTMGFGANFLGHSPDFVMQAVEEQMRLGVEIGPQSPLAGETADLICEMTGMDRATFCNTGSEAVMAALRVARTVTGKGKIVFFRGDYHGVFDEVLARPALVDGLQGAMPVAPGIPHLPHVIVLEYGDFASIETIKARAGEIAAVLIEPIQARHPSLQPAEFIRALREITAAKDIALIFDEVITGFRIAPGGAQEFYGVKADLATYGKVIGGGMPIGVLAGRAKYMDALDGGKWAYGDDSYPEIGVTFFAGTFVRHPLAMAAANAVARYLKQTGPTLQQAINDRTSRFIGRVNSFLVERGLPMRFEHFSAVFFYDFHPDLHYANLLFYYLRNRGVHIWEGRIGHLSTAHTDEDLEQVYQAIRESILDMQAAGFLPDTVAEVHKWQLPEFAQVKFPLAEPQREMWLGAQMQPNAAGPHHACTVLRLEGVLDAGALHRAIELVLERHEGLRSTFSADGTHVLVHPPGRLLQFTTEDLRILAEHERETRIEAILHEEGRRLMDLESGPLATFRLLQLSAEQNLLVFTVQMIVCDGWAHYVVFEDLAAAYSGFVTGKTPSLKSPIPMREFARWQQDNQDSAEARECETFWLTRFRNVPPVLNLPTSKPRQPVRSFDASRSTLDLEKEIVEGVRRVAREQRSSYFAVLLAAFQVWLYRLSGCRDLVVGVPIAAQEPLGMDRLVGQCAGILPLRLSFDPKEPFSECLGRTWSHIIDAKENWNFSFGKLASMLDLAHDPSRIPLVSVLFNIDPPMTKVAFSGLKHQFSPGPRYYFQYDLGFNLVEETDCIRVECDFNTNLFDPEVIGIWLTGYRSLLNGLVMDAKVAAGFLPMIDAAGAQQRGFAHWDNLAFKHVPIVALDRLVVEQASRTPTAIALESNEGQISYQKLISQAERVATYLRTQEVGSGSKVGVCLEQKADLPVVLLAVLTVGAVYVPLDLTQNLERLEKIVSGADLKLLVVDVSTAAALPSIGIPQVIIDAVLSPDSQQAMLPAASQAMPKDGGKVACILHSFDSSGHVQQFEISHGGIVNLIKALQGEPGLTEQDVMLAASPAACHGFFAEVWLPLCVGARVVTVSSETVMNPHDLAEVCDRHNITVMLATPALLQKLLAEGWQGNSRLRIWCGGEELHANLAERLLPLCRELWNLYGASETSGYCLVSRVDSATLITLGKPIGGMSVEIVDDLLQLVPIGVPGHLLIAGVGLAKGCLGQPNQAERNFFEWFVAESRLGRVFRSGDLAKYTTTGEIEFYGSIASQFENNGFSFTSGETEKTLLRHEAVRQAVVVVREIDGGSRILVAYVTTEEGTDSRELWHFLRGQLPQYMLPAQLIFVKMFPLNLCNKIDRGNLPIPDQSQKSSVEQQDIRPPYVSPETSLEKKLAEIWNQVLRLPQIGIHDNFFDLGGQSILAMKVVMQATRMGIALKPRSIFLHPTIAELAREAGQGVNVEKVPHQALWAATGPVPLTPAQLRFLHERNTCNPHRWNFSMLFQGVQLHWDVIEKVVNSLLAHHDALRLRLTDEDGEWSQSIKDTVGSAKFEHHDLALLDTEARPVFIESTCERLQGSLHLSKGPVVQTAFFNCGPSQPSRLFFTMHHFVMDVFSWDIFWEDFCHAYEQALEGHAIVFPCKTTSFREWSMRLRQLAESAEVQEKVSAWLSLPWKEIGRLPLDFDVPPSANTNVSASDVELLLTEEESNQIIGPSNHNRPEELVLAALTKTLTEWTGSEAVLIDCLNHGRGIFADGDLSRTVGFMLCYQPVVLRLSHGPRQQEGLRGIIDQLRSMPEGVTYDVLRFYSPDEDIRNAFKQLPRSQVLFNFTGFQDAAESEQAGRFSPCADACGSDFDPLNGRYALLAVSAAIISDRLRFKFVFSKNLHRPETIKRLVKSFYRDLKSTVKVLRIPR